MKKIKKKDEDFRIFFRYKNDKEYNEIINNHLSQIKKTSGKYAGVALIHLGNLRDYDKAIEILKKIGKK